MSASSTRPPPLAVIGGGGTPYTSSPLFSSASESSSTSIMIVTIIISSAVIISASIYLLLRLLSKRFRRTFSSTADDVVLRLDSHHPQCHVASNDLLDSLPLFTFRSVTHSHRLNGGDCAVCLTKFEPNDRLRLLPLCCHAFHAACIDKWIVSNQTCPLCRSTVLASGADVLDKILSAESRGNLQLHNSFRDEDGNSGSGSFRIEIGSVSLRRGGDAEALGGGRRRSYSLGSFEYIVDDDCVCEVSVGFTSTTHGRGFSEFASNGKESMVGIPESAAPVEVSAVEASGGRNWLREYVDRLASISSRTMSFRSSARFFSGSSRRSEAAVVPEDIEANPVGDEIGELFRWLAGI